LQHNAATTNNSSSVDSTANSTGFNADDEALKTKDTDGDGLSDWDEIHVYKTSPYLEDTDGDGRISRQQYISGFDILDENKDGANFCFSIICFYLLVYNNNNCESSRRCKSGATKQNPNRNEN
jgi:hypothetical protein